ncbi:MAG: LacI family DNA-binding transcriptional regulator [Gordonia sp. (in: high G+C Gram-positive bacteria)]
MIPKKQVAMKAIADSLGMSVSTVSRALRGTPGVAWETQQKVRAEAAALGYQMEPPDDRPATRVGIVLPWPDSWYYSSVIAGAEEVLRTRGIEVVLHCAPTSDDRNRFFTESRAYRSVDALIAVSFPLDTPAIQAVSRLPIPLVTVSVRFAGVPSVTIDDHLAARQAVNQLIRSGHRRIGLIRTTDPDHRSWPADDDRTTGYRDALASVGIDPAPELTATAPWGIAGGADAMAQLLSLEQPPTAAFCFSDEVAIGALRTLRRAGVAVPEMMSVIAIDDHPMAELTGLTTIAQPARQMGVVAAEQIVTLLHGGTVDDIVLPTHLTVRHTIAAPPQHSP